MLTDQDAHGNPKIAEINIELYLSGAGVSTAYGYEGLTLDAAIGHITVVLDRMREERKLQWDTCPGCGLPWAEHFEPEEDEEDGEEE